MTSWSYGRRRRTSEGGARDRTRERERGREGREERAPPAHWNVSNPFLRPPVDTPPRATLTPPPHPPVTSAVAPTHLSDKRLSGDQEGSCMSIQRAHGRPALQNTIFNHTNIHIIHHAHTHTHTHTHTHSLPAFIWLLPMQDSFKIPIRTKATT